MNSEQIYSLIEDYRKKRDYWEMISEHLAGKDENTFEICEMVISLYDEFIRDLEIL